MTDKGVISAIIAAVDAYLQEEEALAAAMAVGRPMLTANLWKASGRQEMMRMQTLWQRRIVSERRGSYERNRTR